MAQMVTTETRFTSLPSPKSSNTGDKLQGSDAILDHCRALTASSPCSTAPHFERVWTVC